jgi:hypothetical protein
VLQFVKCGTVESKSSQVPVVVLLKTSNFWDVKLSVCAPRFRYFERGRNAFFVRVRKSKWTLSGLPGCEDEGASVLRNVKKRQSKDAALHSSALLAVK